MISILTRDTGVQEFAVNLLKEPFFQNDELTLYSDVPVPALHFAHPYHISAKNLCSDRERYRDVCIDLLVCRDDAAVLAICFDEGEQQHELMFRTYLYGLDCLRHKLPALEPVGLPEFYQQVTGALRMLADYQLTCNDYMLYPSEITQDVYSLQCKMLLRNDPMSLLYTRDCGLFFRCTLSGDGALAQTPVTSVPMRTDFSEAVHWQAENSGYAGTLKFILNIPLTELFQTRPDSLDFLKKCLSAAQRHLEVPEDFYVFTYGDCLRMLQKIREQLLAPGAGSKAGEDLKYWHDSILFALAEVLGKGIPFFQLTLQEYFYAAAASTGCHYPIWLYEHHYRPHLCGRPEEEFTVTDFVRACQGHILFSRQSFSVCNSLRELLLAPICVPNAQ